MHFLIGTDPFNVAVKKPHARRVCAETQHSKAIRPNENGVALHRCIRQGRGVPWIVETCIILTALDDLERVTMQVERMFPRIIVVDHNLDDFVTAKNERVGV
jgi:hypothetical protein